MDVLQYLRERPKRLEDSDVDDALMQAAVLWLKGASADEVPKGLESAKRCADHGWPVTVSSARAALNILRSVLGAPSGAHVPDGTYTVVHPDGWRRTLRLVTQRETMRFAPGRQVCSALVGPDNTRDYRQLAFTDGGDLELWQRARLELGTDLVQQVVEAYRVLCGDPLAAAKAYGLMSGRCGLCGRKLTVPESIEAGIGPICAAERGWSL